MQVLQDNIGFSELSLYPLPLSVAEYNAKLEEVYCGLFEDYKTWSTSLEKWKRWSGVEWRLGGAHSPHSAQYAYDSPEQGQYAQNASCDVLFLTGELDGQTPSEWAEKAYAATQMSPGYA